MPRELRCSKCSAIVRPIVAIDLDGTLADYHGHFLDFAMLYLGLPPNSRPYGGGVSFRDWFIGWYDVDVRTWNDIKLAYRQGGMKRTQPIFDNAKRVTDYCRQQGAEVWITTTRPYLRLDGIDPDTRFWLAHHEIDYEGLLYDEDKYHRLAENIDYGRVVAVLDDLPEQYDAASEAFGVNVPILRKNKYNYTIIRPNMATNLMSAGVMINVRIKGWYKEHGA